MINERYSIEVDRDNSEVLFHGHFTVEELLALIDLYRKQGFKYVMYGDENSALRLTKTNFAKIPENKEPQEEEMSLDQVFEKVVNEMRHMRAKSQVDMLKAMLERGEIFPWSCKEEG